MKKIVFSIFALCMGALNATATVITVSNNPNSPGQYTSLQAAIDAANPNDTIYINASAVSYGNVNVWKPLVLIGEGALPNEQIELKPQIGSLDIGHNNSLTDYSSGTGSKIYGLDIIVIFIHGQPSGSLIGNLTIERNKIGSIGTGGTFNASNNMIIRHNVVFAIQVFLKNAVICNNIIGSNIYVGGDANTVVSNLITNNIFTGSQISGAGMIISNNIIYSPHANYNMTGYLVASVYTNNLFYTLNPPVLTNATTTATGNVFGQDPLFTVNPGGLGNGGTSMGNYLYTTTGPFADLHLQSSSLGKNYGTDGTDVGIYGGSTPWPDGEGGGVFRYFPMPSQVPYVISMDVLNPTIPQNGTLNINFNARVQD